MRNLRPVKDYPDLARDMDTGMVVNINKIKHKQHLGMIDRRKKDKEELESLRSEIQEMKSILQKLLENGTNG